MKPHELIAQYAKIDPEERFRLILAASGRDDAVERDKLVKAGKVQNLAFNDHWPYAQAFSEISSFVFMELVEEATIYQEFLIFRNSKRDKIPSDEETTQENDDEEVIDKEWLKEFDQLLVLGCFLQMKLKGWELFCQKLNVPDRLLWMEFPGYQRLESALKISSNLAFTPKGLLRWLNRRRPKGSPKLKRLPLTIKKIAHSNEESYRHRARWWGAKA